MSDLDACRMCGTPEPWPAPAEQPCNLDPACEHPRHDPSAHPCGPKSQNTDDLIRQLDKVTRERDSLGRRCAIRFGEAETLRGEVAQLRDELEQLRANQLPDGGEWDVEYESPDGSDGPYWSDHRWFDSTRQRRIWYGPATPIDPAARQ